MRAIAVSLFALASLSAFAQDFELDDDVPAQCRSLCAPVATISNDCERQTNDDEDSAYIDCVCTATNAQSLIPNCQACIAESSTPDNDDDDDDYDDGSDPNDITELLNRCRFATQTTYSTPGPSATASIAPVPTSVSTTSSGSAPTNTNDSSDGDGGDDDNDGDDRNNNNNGNSGSGTGGDGAAAGFGVPYLAALVVTIGAAAVML